MKKMIRIARSPLDNRMRAAGCVFLFHQVNMLKRFDIPTKRDVDTLQPSVSFTVDTAVATTQQDLTLAIERNKVRMLCDKSSRR